MLNIVWPVFIIISILYAICFGNLENLNNSIFESTASAVNLCITLIGTMCLWSGIMKIASETSFTEKITKILRPVMKILFPKMKKDSKLYKEISMNMVANILGLGNAATPLGIKAMKTMQENNTDKKVLTDEMAIFIVLNTASLQLIPTTVIAVRASMGSTNAAQIILPVWIVTLVADTAGIIASKLLMKKF